MKSNYFPLVSLLLVLLTLIAFSDNLVTDVGQPSNSDPKFIVHGLFCLAWMICFALQAQLVRTRNLRWHRQFGSAAFFIAAGVTLSTLYVFVTVWTSWAQMSPEVRANRLLLPSYSLCVLFAWLQRRNPEWHRRLLYVGTLYMLDPVLARIPPLSWSDFWFYSFMVAVWSGLFLSLFVYDWKTARRIHPATSLGFGWLYLAWAIAWYS
ncbi:MAG: hypothetical protein ABW278_04970 [Steroidobacteraceae bacterium]